MGDQRIGVFLLEGVFSLEEALGLELAVTIGGVKCRVMLPVRAPTRGRWPVSLSGPPSASGGADDQGPVWPLNARNWGDPHPSGFIIRAVGITPAGTAIPSGDKQVAFDGAVAQWRHVLRDWLAVAAEGPTDFADRDYYGATVWGSAEYDDEETPYQPLESGHRRRVQPRSARDWTHAIEHATADDQPPLTRVMMTSAARAAGTADWRTAIIDAATATEAALTVGMAAQAAMPQTTAIQKRLAKTIMLGPLLDLADALGMLLPPNIRTDLKDRRNDALHQGVKMTSAYANAAIEAAWEVVRAHDPLPACCGEPRP